MNIPSTAAQIPVSNCTLAPPRSQFPPCGQFQQEGSMDELEGYEFGASGFKLYEPGLQNEHTAGFPPVNVFARPAERI